tara:strand:+ start:211 stop:786 length:576 start_codon:yes stop_codon:yes gene_type:complete
MSEINENSLEGRNKFLEYIKKYKKYIISILILLLVTIISAIITNNLSVKKNEDISKLFNKANILIKQEKKKEALKIYEEIVLKKNKFYSPISLNAIIENNLIPEKSIDEMFDELIKIRGLAKEEKNLIRLKKGIYLSGQNNENELLNSLSPLINENSIWKILAAKTLRDFYLIRGEKNKSLQYDKILEKSE